ncbi:MAG TPA: ATP-binding protein, partial [Actinomycetota bacterium]|nr:ATP-binding protein [Actinomycetota bacterium]
MAILGRELDRAIAGEPRLLLLAGEPGIGKTRLAQELVASAASRGMATAWGRCIEGGGVAPFLPWRQVLGSLARAKPASLDALAPGVLQELATITPAFGDRPPEASSRPMRAEERFRLFDSVCAFVGQACEEPGAAVVLDDLHWADPS